MTILVGHLHRWSKAFGPGSIQVLRRLGLMTVAFGFAKLLMMIANMVVARKLGLEDFGHGGLLFVGATALATFMQAGVPQAMNVYCARSNKERQPEISFGFVVIGILSALFTGITYLFQERVANYLRLSEEELRISLLLGFVFSLYTMASSIMQGIHMARLRALSEFVMNAVAAGLMILLLPYYHLLSIPYALLIGYLCGILVVGPTVLSRLNPKVWVPAGPISRQILSYAGFSFLCSVGFLFTYNFQNLQIDRLLDRSEVGYYRVVALVTTGTAFTFSSITATILIAKAVSITGRLEAYWRMLRIWLLLAAPGVIAFILCQYPVMWIIKYPFDGHVALAFAIASIMIMVQTSLGQVMAAHGVFGAAVGVGLSVLLAVSTYWSSELLIPHLGVAGCGWGLAIGYGVCALVQSLLARWYFSLPTGEGAHGEEFSNTTGA